MENDYIYTQILDFLNRDSFQSIKKSQFLKVMDKPYASYRKFSSKVFDGLQTLVDDNPQMVLDLTNEFLNSKESLTKLIDVNYKARGEKPENQKSYPEKMTAIAGLYEISSLFSLTMYILSDRRLNIHQLNNLEPRTFLKHLKTLGLKNRDIEDIRIIRNAASHTFTFDDQAILFNNEQVTFSRIDDLHTQLNDLMNWNASICIYSFFLIPKFLTLVCLSIYMQYVEHRAGWLEYKKGLYIMYDEFAEHARKKEERQKSQKNLPAQPVVKGTHKKESSRSSSTRFVLDNYDVIFGRLSYHANSIADMLHELHDKIDKQDEREAITKVESWIRKQGDGLNNVVERIKNNPDLVKKIIGSRSND